MRPAAALALVLVLAAGCDTSPTYRPRGTQTVVLAPDKPAPSVEMEVVTGLRVVLPRPAPGADLVWEIVSNNAKVLPQTDGLRDDPAGPIGTKATESVSFYAAHPGRSVVRFVLVHPGDLDAVPTAKCLVTVHVTDD
jgi:hypothetical protein